MTPSLLLCFVLAVWLHNLEEALFLPRWSEQAGRWHRPVGAAAFRFAVTVLSMALLLLAGLAWWQGPQSLAAYLFAGYVFAMGANAVIPHLLATVALRRYMPGTATGVLLNLPLGVYVLQQAVTTAWVDGPTLLWAAPVVALALVGSIPVLLALGKVLRGGP